MVLFVSSLLLLLQLLPPVVPAMPFTTVWSSFAANDTIVLPYIDVRAAANISIDWGDGNITNVTGPSIFQLNHTYASADLYNVSMNGQFYWTPNANGATKNKLVDIASWGDGFLVDSTSATLVGDGMFSGYYNLQVSASPNDQPVFLPGATLRDMFYGTSFNSSLNWDLNNTVTDLSEMFRSSHLNQPITFRNTQGVTSTAGMFLTAAQFNQPFHFDASNLTRASGMFSGAAAFNQVINLTNSRMLSDVASMFVSAVSFNQPINFNTSQVTDMSDMFNGATSFNQPINFDTPRLANTAQMFMNAVSFNQSVVLNTSSVVTMYRMFFGVNYFTQNLSSWDTTNVTDCEEFCPWCGLPSFTKCTPCTPIFTDAQTSMLCSSRSPTTAAPTTTAPTQVPTTAAPTTTAPTTAPTAAPTAAPTQIPTTTAPTTAPTVALPFVTTWDATANTTIILPVIKTSTNFTINWGDTNSSTFLSIFYPQFQPSHTYASAGLYNVSISGEFYWTAASGSTTTDKLVDIVSWGTVFLIDNSSTNLFYSYYNLGKVSAPPNTQPVFLPGATLRNMFSFTGFNPGSSFDWDLENVVDISSMFTMTLFNQPIIFRNTGGVTSIATMFGGASKFNQPFHFDDASGLTDASEMFYGATVFNQVVNLTNSRALTNTASMFWNAFSFNQPLLLNTDSVTTMQKMFSGAIKFNQPVDFNTTQVTDMSYMFSNARDFNQPINFSTPRLNTTVNMFSNASSFTSTVTLTLTTLVTNMSSMFSGVNYFTQNLSSWDTANVTDCSQFCPWCGLPNFPQCSPCVPIYNNSQNMSVCSDGTRAPTGAPTTGAPSRAPTRVPTTKVPTAAPTRAPTTTAPSTKVPTAAPTTTAPSTRVPTATPTITPTTAAPTAPTAPTTTVPTTVAPTAAMPTLASALNVTQAETVVSNTSGGSLVLSTVIVNIPPDPVWGSGGTFSATVQTAGSFKNLVGNQPPNEVLTDVASLNFAPVNGTITSIPLIGQAISFSMALTAPGAALLQQRTEICDGPVKLSIFPEALCVYYDHNASTWDQKGCTRKNVTNTSVVCECTHLTDFSVILPNYNLVRLQDILLVDQRSIVRHPVGIVTLAVLYGVFLLTAAYARYYDIKDQLDEKGRQDKEAKWRAKFEAGDKEPFWKRYQSQIQRRHTWFSLYFRKRGTSYRSIDRTCVTFISVLTIMSLSAYFYGKGQTWIGYASIVVFSSLVSFIPLIGLEMIFMRIGPPGYKDAFELSSGIRPVPEAGCCRWWALYRMPIWVAPVLYVVLLGVAAALSAIVMLFAFEFDTSDEFVCNGKGSASWVVSVLIAIVVNIFVVQPLKILAMCAIASRLAASKPSPIARRMIELERSQSSTSMILESEEAGNANTDPSSSSSDATDPTDVTDPTDTA